jgi:hypothetical protein
LFFLFIDIAVTLKLTMPIPENILNQIKCCLNNNDHFINEPILLECGANACKKCVFDSTNSTLRCYSCNGSHERNDLLNAPINKMVVSVIELFSNDLIQNLNESLESSVACLKGLAFLFLLKSFFTSFLQIIIDGTIINEMQVKIQSIENEIEMRVGSLIVGLNKYRDDSKLKLKEYNDDFVK